MSQPAFEFDDAEPDDGGELTYSVCELAEAINDQFRRGFRGGLWVRGEINGLQHRGPHTYFSLVEDGDDGKGVLRVQLFAPAKRRLTPILKRANLELRDGMKVRIRGVLDYWAQGGSVGLKMAEIDPRYTLGDIAQSRDEVMRRLVASGLIDPQQAGAPCHRSRCASAWRRASIRPRGLTSAASCRPAASHSSSPWPTLACKATAPTAWSQGRSARWARGAREGVLDVIVVIRGGGARNELAVFDSARIAQTIAAAPIPVLTGLGHETDRSIADEVAHTALKTPTACAGALIERVAAYTVGVEAAFEAIVRRSLATTDGAERRLHDTARRIAGRANAAVERADERLTMRQARLATLVPAALDRSTARLAAAAVRLGERSTSITERERSRLDLFAARVDAVDPGVQLARGWTITRNADGEIVRSAADLSPGRRHSRPTSLDGRSTSVIDTVNLHPVPAPSGDTESDPEPMTDTPGYADALSELDTILRELEGSDVDVDRLAERVARASELITVCRDKITTADLQIRQVTRRPRCRSRCRSRELSWRSDLPNRQTRSRPTGR